MTAPTQLEYAPRPALLSRRRVRRIIAIVLALTLAVTALWQRQRIDQLRRRAEFLYYQRKLLKFSPPDTQVVFENDPASIAPLRGQADFYELPIPTGGSVVLWQHPYIHGPAISANRSGGIGLVFIHERATPAGERFLLRCLISPTWNGQQLLFDLEEFHPATWSFGTMPRNGLSSMLPELDRALAARQHVRLYAGQADPKDPTHFTIRCEIDGKEEFIDGYEGDRKVRPDGLPVPGLRLEFRPHVD